jgi:hypothetical protein
MATQKRKGFQPVKRPGALTRKAKAAGESVQQFARQHYHDPGVTGKQARFAKIARTWRHGGRPKHRASRRS